MLRFKLLFGKDLPKKKKKLKAKCAMYFDKFQLCNVDGYGIRGSRTGLSQSLFMGSGIYLIDKWV